MSYYILAHRKKRIAALDLGNVFTIEILGVEAGAATILAEEDFVDDVSGDSGDEEIIGVEVISLVQSGEFGVETILSASRGGDISVSGSEGGDIDITGGTGDEEAEGTLPPED